MSILETSVGLRSYSARGHTRVLAQEILHLIVEQLCVPDNLRHTSAGNADVIFVRPVLCSLRLVSKSFDEAASRMLFRRMISEDGPTHSAFLRTLIKNPRLARHVRVYYTPTSDVRTGHVYNYIKTCLPLMTGLKELVYRKLIPGRRKPLPRHFPNLKTRKKPFQLKNFIWVSDDWRPEEDDKALEFLSTQRNLDYLRWISTKPLPPSYKEKIPHSIRFLDASVETLVAILPERLSIEGVRWRRHSAPLLDHLTTADIQGLSKKLCRMDEFHRLSFLSLAIGYEPTALEYLCSDPKLFPRLTTLALVDIDFTSDMTLGRTFPELQEVYFSKIATQHYEDHVKKKVNSVFRSNLLIRHVNIREDAPWMPNCWHRFIEWRQGRSNLPVERVWDMSPDYKYSKLLFESSISLLNPIWDASPL